MTLRSQLDQLTRRLPDADVWLVVGSRLEVPTGWRGTVYRELDLGAL